MKAAYVCTSLQAQPPVRHHDGDAGWDLATCKPAAIGPGCWVEVPTDIAIQAPNGIYFRLVPRSSTFRTHGLLVHEGIIDNGYRGKLQILVHNPSKHTIHLPANTRLAQLIPHKLIEIEWEEKGKLTLTDRGDNGYGSTGQ